ncbi:hemerythrin domain-containing protein [Thalassomonas viridans]|uniref:Hemerythrin domain-containing protein n=1 Tax=Thalassomonas viridans TaxID=137584 RepID=A0AAE9YY52_9GAMM|nr:hemerythrin domain-containing protein [Thalassomonas viridans]WDE03371.1 hemerythrin domain-containing protein [Thalassomonas viridans]
MSSIPDYMTAQHRHCDDVFSAAESAVALGNWPLAQREWKIFTRELEAHLEAEENILFPRFEQATGITQGPTMVMRSEHEQMRALVQQLTQALEAGDQEVYLGLSETLMVLMQQHNMKEEMMLYPMSQQHISDGEQTLNDIRQHCESDELQAV